MQLIGRRIGRITSTAVAADVEAWWEQQAVQAGRVVAGGTRTAAQLAERWMRQHAAIEGVELEPVRAQPDLDEIATSLRVTGPVAFKTNIARTGSEEAALQAMRTRLAGAAARLTLNGDRGTVTGTMASTDRIVGYRRVTAGNPCAFCAMLASRGAVYRAGGGVSPTGSGITFAAHDSCRCTAEPLYEREPEPESVQQLRRQWDEATAGLSGREALAAFRQARS